MSPAGNDSSGPDANELDGSLATLLRLSDKLSSISDLDNLLEALVQQVIELTSAESGCAGLRTPNGMSCVRFLKESAVAPLVYDCGPGIGWAGWVLANETHYLTNDALNDTAILPEIRERLVVTAGMCIPILGSGKEVIGFFEVYNKKSGGGFNGQDLRNSLAAARIASLPIQSCQANGRLMALAAFSQALTATSRLEDILEAAANHIRINLDRGAAIFLPSNRSISLRFRTPEFAVTDHEMEAATWCWKSGREAGAGTAAVFEALAHYFPLTVCDRVIGVLGLVSKPGAWFPARRRELLELFIRQSALAVERGLLEEKVSRLRFPGEPDRLQNALLAAVSHEVRAPLAAITAAISGILNSSAPLGQEHERRLLQTAGYEAQRLHRLMSNLLNVTRLQGGYPQVKLEPCDLLDIAYAALEELGNSTRERQVFLDISPELPLVPMDFELITQVLVNLFSNALKFSPIGRPIHLGGRIAGGELEVTVADRGPGVPEEHRDRVFQRFHRLAESSSADGLGLGLSICREFIEAHRGRIRLEPNPGGGTIVKFVLPLHASIGRSDAAGDQGHSL